MRATDAPAASPPDESALVAALRRGDEAAYARIVAAYAPSLAAVARRYVREPAVVEEVVQETWLAFMRGLDGFQGRSSLKTWLFGILINVAMAHGRRERRCTPFSGLAGAGEGPTVEPERFIDDPGHRWDGHWQAAPADWSVLPEDRVHGRDTLAAVKRAIEELPVRQRRVIALRDLQGATSEEACRELGLSEGNQRVLLHRARAHVRAALEREFDAHIA
jgi:RNA polymerase sigma-70 factor, ECF subfamily